MDLERFCDEWFAAWTGGDPARLLAYYDEGATYADPAKPRGVRGRDALARYFGRLLPANPEMVWTRRELHRFADPGDAEHAFAVRWAATIPVGGAVVTENGCDLVWLRGGRIVRNEVYFDRAAWLAALKRDP